MAGSGWVRTLERAPAGAARASERRLLGAGGEFRAVVQPCLPGAPPPAGGAAGPGAEWPGGAARVQTVPAQLTPRWGRGAALRDRLRGAAAAGGGGPPGTSAPEALLLVSGGHPWRTRLTRPLLASSFDLLRAAAQLREAGELPARTALWAVENPLRERGAGRLERKLEAGAEAVITQPPLLRGRFEAWWEDLQARGLLRDARVLVGVPFLTSPESLRFWLRLADCDPDDPAAGPHLRALAAQPPGPGREAACQELAAETLRWVERLPGAGGVHLMPVTPAGYRCAEAVLAAGEYRR